MSDKLTPDSETRLEAWLAGRVPADPPSSFVERVHAIPRESPADGRSDGWRRGQRGRRRPPMLLAATVALVTVGLLGGAVIMGSSHQATVAAPSEAPVDARASVAPSPAPASPAATLGPVGKGLWPGDFRSRDSLLPASVPAGVEHGLVDTPFGRARWVHLTGDRTSLPDPMIPAHQPGGAVVWFDGGGSQGACSVDPKASACTDPPRASLTVADDLLGPRVARPLPDLGTGAGLVQVGDRWWYIASGPAAALWSDDLETWHSTDLSALVSPGPTGLAYETSLGSPQSFGATTLLSVSFDVTDPGGLLGHPGRQVSLKPDGSGGYRAVEFRPRSQGGDVDLGQIRVKESDTGLAFLDGDGRTVGEVPGVGLAFAEAWAHKGTLRYPALLILDGDRWVPVDLPGPGLADDPTLAVLGGTLWAFALDANDEVRAWRSDGGRWTGGDPAATDAGAPLKAANGIYVPGDGRVEATEGDGTTTWATTDGQHWTRSADSATFPAAQHVSQGWIRTPDQTEGFWQFSTDGTTWVDYPALSGVVDKIAPDGSGGSSETAIGDTLFFDVDEGEAPYHRDLWAIEFEAPAGP